MNHPTLVKTLASLSPSDFELLVVTVPNAARQVSRHGTIPERAAELIRWAEGPLGCGMVAIEEALAGISGGELGGTGRTQPDHHESTGGASQGESSKRKKAFVLMPFRPPFDSYYPAIFRPALEAASYDVYRGDDLFSPRPIILDIQRQIVESDIMLCELSDRNPNVFYELGLAHAVGKPAILVARKEEDIPFDIRHIRTIIYDYSRAGWEAELRKAITAAAQAIETSDEVWPPPLTLKKLEEPKRALLGMANEIEFNLEVIGTFESWGYAMDGLTITALGVPNAELEYVTCSTKVFESVESQSSLEGTDEQFKKLIIKIYHSFFNINNKADALKEAFRPWRVASYLKAIEQVEKSSGLEAIRRIRAMRRT